MAVTEFWSSTPYEIILKVEGWTEYQSQNQKDNITQAWLTALWCSFTKKLPKLEKLLRDMDSKPEKEKLILSTTELTDIAKRKNLKGPW